MSFGHFFSLMSSLAYTLNKKILKKLKKKKKKKKKFN